MCLLLKKWILFIHGSMTIYIILGIIVILLIVLSLYGWIWHEDFENPSALSPELQAKYDKFKTFYDSFMVNWTKAVATSLTSSLPAPEAAPEDPTQSATSTPTSPTNQELNAHVKELSAEIKKTLPNITGPLPATLTKVDLSALAKATIDPKRFQNALDWMNENMDASHKALDQALTQMDGFEDMCQQIIQCNEEQQRKEAEKQQLTEEQIGKLFDSITTNQALQTSVKRNKELVAKSKEIQDQAQSGALLNKFQASTEDDQPKMSAPAGSNLWKKMKEDDPEKAQHIQRSMKAIVGVKEWADTINSNLR